MQRKENKEWKEKDTVKTKSGKYRKEYICVFLDISKTK